jgi:segregation and condensation protein B
MNTISDSKAKQLLEATIFKARDPISLDKIIEKFQSEVLITKRLLKKLISEIQLDYEGRGVILVETGGGYSFRVNNDVQDILAKAFENKPKNYSSALLETLALIAYKQPITKAGISSVRGVDVNTHIMNTIIDRGWVKIVGTMEVPGRPNLYATTKAFLDNFGLKSLNELPELKTTTLGELKSGIEQFDIDLETNENELSENK